MKKALWASLCALLLAGCVDTTGRGGYYYDDDDYDSGRGYYSRRHQQRPGPTYYNNSDASERRRRMEADCVRNYNYCTAICYSSNDPYQRNACINNCNASLHMCRSQR